MNRNIKSLRLVITGLVIASASGLVVSTSYASSNTLRDATAAMDPVAVSLAAAVMIVLVTFLVWNRRAKLAVETLAGLTGLTRIPRFIWRGETAEQKDYEKFLNEVRSGPSIQNNQPAPAEAPKQPTSDSLKKIFEEAPGHLIVMQKLVAKCREEKAPVARHEKLLEITIRLASLKDLAGMPELRPAWQLCVALEGLLKQLTRRINDVNHSTLRTIENAVALLSELCVPGIRADLASNPSIKILAVDDDPIIGSALVASVKKAFDQPDLALNGEGALALARKQRYDLITLDVMMPNMDGFEVCDKIRQNATNKTTPVLFVTALSDFESRTKLLAGGGNEVMGKPFLTFELTVKALDMILRDRLRSGIQAAKTPNDSPAHGAPAVNWPSIAPAAIAEKHDTPIDLPQNATAPTQAGAAAMALLPPPVFVIVSPTAKRQLSPKFLDYVPMCVADMKERIAAFDKVDEPVQRKEMAARLHLRLHCLARVMDVPELRPAYELSRALEVLFQKFATDPKHIVSTSLSAATTALDLLKDLCRPEVRPDLVDKPAFKLLVVDDEPLARRALTGALQLGFARPLNADCGSAALELLAQQEFDMVFADICMPGMDGFTLCEKLRVGGKNRSTPVVFVTSHSDQDFRTRATECGGTDFIVKPFIFAEISLKALTVTLRNRLEKDKTSAAKPAPLSSPITEPQPK